MEHTVKIKSVDGSVIEIDDKTVLCEVYIGSNNVNIRLPVSDMPEKIKQGSPITLTIDESGEFSRPLISMRKLDKSKAEKFTQEIDGLIKAFLPPH